MLTHDDLRQFTGTEQWFRHGLMRNILYTEGVQYLVEKANAYWLLDKIATLQMEPAIKAQEFQVWKLMVSGNTVTLTCEDGNDHPVYAEDIAFTDFPLPTIELWVEGNVILLPSEH